jgi:S1-C subfamily serine protease
MSRHLIPLLAALATVSMVGCEKSKLREDMTGDSIWETSAGEEPWEAADEPAKRGDAWEPQSRVISRERLLVVLDEGLGRFLQNVEVEPVFHKGAFVGYRIISLFPGEPAFASIDLRADDTVTRINGKPIGRPEQAVAVWEELRTASHLVVDYRRGDEERELRFPIVDER